MRIYLLQHGKSKSKEEDPGRSLNEEGIEETKRVGQFLSHCGFSVSLIRHSGKARAEQTATLLAAELPDEIRVEQSEGLAPLDEPQVIAQSLGETSEDTLLVGHLPHLERLAALLLSGSPEAKPVQFQNSGVVCLERSEEGAWSVLWALVPKLLSS